MFKLREFFLRSERLILRSRAFRISSKKLKIFFTEVMYQYRNRFTIALLALYAESLKLSTKHNVISFNKSTLLTINLEILTLKRDGGLISSLNVNKAHEA